MEYMRKLLVFFLFLCSFLRADEQVREFCENRILCISKTEMIDYVPKDLVVYLIQHNNYQCAYLSNPLDMKSYPYGIHKFTFEEAKKIFYFYNLYFPMQESTYKCIYDPS